MTEISRDTGSQSQSLETNPRSHEIKAVELLEDTFQTLKRRVGDTSELEVALLEFISSLNNIMHYGNSHEKLSPKIVGSLESSLAYFTSKLRLENGGSVTDAVRVRSYVESHYIKQT
jgi:hypothetical protein